jgi:hypothetical protein
MIVVRRWYASLTAGFASAGAATVVGDVDHGWFWLPRRDIWHQWARDEIAPSLSRLRKGGFARTVVSSGLSRRRNLTT